jgi:taurine dioxygenase
MGKLKVQRLGYALGAEVVGVDGTRVLDSETIATIRQAWLDHIVVCLRGQALDPEQFRNLCGQLGELDVEHSVNSGSTSATNCVPGLAEVRIRANQSVVVDGMTIGKSSPADRWHSDYSWKESPTTMTCLLAKDMPEVGGDTMFANQYMAYETLSPAFQQMIEPLRAVRDYALGAASYESSSPEQQARAKELHPPVEHPVVLLHPETGRKALYVDAFVRNFVGMTEEESKPIIEFLRGHATRYELVYRHRWSVNDLLMWDNRCALHFAVQDYDQSELRRTIRASLVGTRTGCLHVERGAEEPAMALAT